MKVTQNGLELLPLDTPIDVSKARNIKMVAQRKRLILEVASVSLSLLLRGERETRS